MQDVKDEAIAVREKIEDLKSRGLVDIFLTSSRPLTDGRKITIKQMTLQMRGKEAPRNLFRAGWTDGALRNLAFETLQVIPDLMEAIPNLTNADADERSLESQKIELRIKYIEGANKFFDMLDYNHRSNLPPALAVKKHNLIPPEEIAWPTISGAKIQNLVGSGQDLRRSTSIDSEMSKVAAMSSAANSPQPDRSRTPVVSMPEPVTKHVSVPSSPRARARSL